MYLAISILGSLLFFIFIVWFVVFHYLPKYYVGITQNETSKSPYRLARITRKILSFIHGFFVLMLIFIPPILSGVLIYHAGDPEWKADIIVFTGLSIDQKQLPDLNAYGISDQKINGMTLDWSIMPLKTTNKLSYYLHHAGNLILTIGYLYFFLQARNLFVSLSFGKAFTHKNSVRLKKIGFVILASQVFTPLWRYFVWRATFMNLSLNTGTVHLSPPWPFDPDIYIVILGLALLVFSGIVKEAKQMSDEQRLTI